jgi:predicted transposase YdaD
MPKAELVKAVFQKIDQLTIARSLKKKYYRAIEILTINTSLEPIVAQHMNIYGFDIDIRKDRLDKVGKEEGFEEGNEKGRKEGKVEGKIEGKIEARRELAVNTAKSMREDGYSGDEIKRFLVKHLQLTPAEIQAYFSKKR